MFSSRMSRCTVGGGKPGLFAVRAGFDDLHTPMNHILRNHCCECGVDTRPPRTPFLEVADPAPAPVAIERDAPFDTMSGEVLEEGLDARVHHDARAAIEEFGSRALEDLDSMSTLQEFTRGSKAADAPPDDSDIQRLSHAVLSIASNG